MGAVYDLLRITRIFLGVHYSRRGTAWLFGRKLPLLKPRPRQKENPALGVIVFFEDFLFCIFCGIALILLFYGCNNGKIRYSVFPIAAIGFLLYRGTLGKAVMLFSECIAFAVGAFFRYVFFFLSFPFSALGRCIKTTFHKLILRAGSAREAKKRRRYTQKECARSTLNACGLLSENVSMPRSIKRGKRLVKKQKTVQPDLAGPHFAGYADRGVDRCVRIQRDAV